MSDTEEWENIEDFNSAGYPGLDKRTYQQEEDLTTTYRHHELERNISQSDFTCGCCYELMVQPTTLNCGHSFCRICLARWFLTSHKSECPTCRQQWHGSPAVNVIIRNLIVKSFKNEYAERERNVMTSEAAYKIAEFEKKLTATPQKKKEESQAKDFCSGILFAVGIILVIYLAWYWRNSDADLLINKPIRKWSVDDVSHWLNDLGEWTEHYVSAVTANKVEGYLLLGIDESSIETTLNVTIPLHKNAILHALEVIKEQGVKLPTTLWEFKALHPGLALFIMYGLKDYPRSTMLYLYWFKYDELFVPILHSCSPTQTFDDQLGVTVSHVYNPDTNPVRWDQFIDFATKFTFLPYWTVARFTWSWLDIHFWTSRFVLANCIVLTILEANALKWFINGGWRQTRSSVKAYVKGCVSALVFMIVWPVVPSFICDCFFYVALYFSPYLNFEKLYKSLRNR